MALALVLDESITAEMPLPQGDEDLLLQVIPSDGPGKFNLWQRPAANPGSSRFDQLLVWGYNCAKGGGAEVAGEPALCWGMESFWHDGGFPRTEWYQWFVGRDGNRKDFLLAELQQLPSGVDTVNVNFKASSYGFLDQNHVRWLQLSSQALILSSPGAKVVKEQNNECGWSQRGPTLALRCLSYVDNTNRVVIGDPGVAGVTVNGSLKMGGAELVYEGGKLCIHRNGESTKCFVEETP